MNLTVKYTIVSLMATAADFSIFKLLENVAVGFHAVATLIGMLVGAVVSWTLHRYWVFEASAESENHKRSTYLIGQFLCVALNVGLMAIVADWLNFPRMPSRVVTSITVWLIIYFFNRKVVFKV